ILGEYLEPPEAPQVTSSRLPPARPQPRGESGAVLHLVAGLLQCSMRPDRTPCAPEPWNAGRAGAGLLEPPCGRQGSLGTFLGSIFMILSPAVLLTSTGADFRSRRGSSVLSRLQPAPMTTRRHPPARHQPIRVIVLIDLLQEILSVRQRRDIRRTAIA